MKKVLFPILALVLALGLALPMAAPALASQITLIKEVTPATPNIYYVGDTITYECTVQNPVGNAATNTYTTIEDLLPNGTLVTLATNVVQTPGQSNTYYTTYVVALADINPVTKKVKNLLHAVGTDSLGDEIDATTAKTSLIIQPDIDVTKTVVPDVSKVDDSVVYTITVTNTGDVELTNITVIDSLLGDLSGSYADTLASMASESHTFPYTILAGDPDPLVNTVTVTGTDPLVATVTATASASVDLVHPGIAITKTADPTTSKVGDEVVYTITVTNTGDIGLENIVVTDTLLGDLSGSYADTLASMASESHTFPYTILAGDPDLLVNTVTVDADPLGPLTNPVSATASAEVILVHPSIAITKTVEPGVSKAGDSVVYTITVENTGDVDLENIVVDDDLLGPLAFAPTLASGDSETNTFPYVIQPGDPDPLVNTVTVDADPLGPLTNPVTASASAEVDLVHPSIAITKTVEPGVSKAGHEVVYTITVENTGDVDLENIVVMDSLLGPLPFAPTLASGDSETNTFPYVIQPGDPDPLMNTVTVNADPLGPLTNPVSASASASVDLVHPDIAITKTVEPGVSKVGHEVIYTITVENTGDVDLENIVVMDSLLMGPLPFAPTLASGGSETNTFPYLIMAGDPDPLMNTVTVDADPLGLLTNPVSASASASVDLVHPDIAITKTVEPGVSKVGHEVIYTITVENTGDVGLENIVVMDSLLMGPLPFAPTLASGGSETHTFPYLIMAGDPDPLMNTVTVNADPLGPLTNPVTASASATVDLVRPSIAITKTADPDVSKAGDEVVYTITVENTGDVTLENIVVMDSLLGPLPFAPILASGDSETHTFPYVIQPGDPDPLVNTVTVTANPEGMPNVITATTSVEVDLVHPAIAITKTANPTSASVDDIITYTIVVTNTGDVTLEHIMVVDDLLGDLSGSYADTLASMASESHDFTRAILAGDPDPLVNTVTVDADPLGPLTNPVSASASASVEIVGEATRTPGFWKTHYDYTMHVFDDHLGGSINLGWVVLNGEEDVFGMFWANTAKDSDGDKRDDLNKARVKASYQALSAIFNTGLTNGAPLPMGLTLADIASILGGTDIDAIDALHGTLGAYNSSGDYIPIEDADGYPIMSADPKAAKDVADFTIAD